MTIEHIIERYLTKLALAHVYVFYGYELSSFVCNEMKNLSGKIVKEESVLRRLRNGNQFGKIEYECIDQNQSKYRIINRKAKLSL